MSANEYLVKSLSVTILMVLMVAVINLRTDPFGVFGNSRGGIYIFEERSYKARHAATRQYEVLLIGSSKTAVFNADHLPETRIYNASFAAAQLGELQEFLETYGGRAETVLIGLDPYMFN